MPRGDTNDMTNVKKRKIKNKYFIDPNGKIHSSVNDVNRVDILNKGNDSETENLEYDIRSLITENEILKTNIEALTIENTRLKLELEKQKQYYEKRERHIVELLDIDINKL
jgi:hypothetical protein